MGLLTQDPGLGSVLMPKNVITASLVDKAWYLHGYKLYSAPNNKKPFYRDITDWNALGSVVATVTFSQGDVTINAVAGYVTFEFLLGSNGDGNTLRWVRLDFKTRERDGASSGTADVFQFLSRLPDFVKTGSNDLKIIANIIIHRK